jgi:DNA-binding beta-propeller fold protein YncE
MRKTAGVVIGTLCVAAWTVAMVNPAKVLAGQDAGSSYKLVENWAQLPSGKQWGQMSAVGVDAKGNVYAFERAEPSSIIVFDDHGKYLKTFGDESMTYAHGLSVARDGSIWATDRKVEQAFKFDSNGKLLLTLGQKNVAGDNTSPDSFNGVSDIAVATNGDIFASDGEGANTRVVKFAKDGKFIKMWGTKGSGQGQLNTPHNLAIDSKGRVWVADRGNKRLQVFDQDGKYLDQMTQFGTPVSLAFDKNDVMYVADGAPENQVVIGTTDGKVLETIHGLDAAHGIAVSPSGSIIYVSETGGKSVLKYAKK